LKLKPNDAITFKLKEQQETYSSNYLWNWSRDDLLKRVGFYVKKKFIDEKLENKLKAIAELIQKVNEKSNLRNKLTEERDLMTDEQARLRENIAVLGDDNQSTSLKERYIKKFDNQESRFETISTELDKLDKEINSLNKEIETKMNKLKA
jgi:chromosome segregation ATPase